MKDKEGSKYKKNIMQEYIVLKIDYKISKYGK